MWCSAAKLGSCSSLGELWGLWLVPEEGTVCEKDVLLATPLTAYFSRSQLSSNYGKSKTGPE